MASMIRSWIDDEGLAPSEIAVLVSRQPELYADRLMAALVNLGVPFRNEQNLQDLSAEPAARLIVDFLTVVIGDRAPDAFSRLKNMLEAGSFDDEAAYEMHARWHRFLDSERESVRQESFDSSDPNSLRRLSDVFLEFMGRESLAALSADYERGARLEEVISQTHERIAELLQLNNAPLQALSRFSEDSAVRIMTIHKSKGLEFDTVVVLGVE